MPIIHLEETIGYLTHTIAYCITHFNNIKVIPLLCNTYHQLPEKEAHVTKASFIFQNNSFKLLSLKGVGLETCPSHLQ